MNAPAVILLVLASLLVVPFVIYGGFVVFLKLFSAVFFVLGRILGFIGAEFTDTLRVIGGVIAAVVFAPLIVLAVVIGRWSRSRHYALAMGTEIRGVFSAIYRILIGNPAYLLGLSAALEGIERRVPDAMAAAPTRDTPSKKRVGIFDGYTIVGSLKGGGSGGKLYIAEPNDLKRAGFEKRGMDIDQVVIKVFSLSDGSSLPQIVRESRALDAARNLGLVLEHELTKDRFYYVMRYVPGETLSAVTTRLHTTSSSEGLSDKNLNLAMGYASDLLRALSAYHDAGLWHKDVKPDNIIVDASRGESEAQLVDFGLVTPLRSAMTLTTHGTEYFRDPELVRQALRGVKVHQTDGTRFDVYGAGAVLYSVIENSFPAHAGLSQITKRCPDALRWIVRRAMAEYDKRYATTHEMLADLRVVMNASDPFALKPVDLPSVSGADTPYEPTPAPNDDFAAAHSHAAASPVPPRATPGRQGRVGRPSVRLVDWWTGKYAPQAGAPTPVTPEAAAAVDAADVTRVVRPANRPMTPADSRASAKDQLSSARSRARASRKRAAHRRIEHAKRSGRYKNDPHPLVVVTVLGFIMTLFALGVFLTKDRSSDPSVSVTERYTETHSERVTTSQNTPAAPAAPASPETLPAVDARALLVSDASARLDAVSMESLDAKLNLLAHYGLNMIGRDQSDASIQRIAEFRNAIGAVPSDSSAYIAKAQAWLADQDDIDLVLVVRDSERDPSVLMVAGGFYTKSGIGDRTVGDLLSVLDNNGFSP